LTVRRISIEKIGIDSPIKTAITTKYQRKM